MSIENRILRSARTRIRVLALAICISATSTTVGDVTTLVADVGAGLCSLLAAGIFMPKDSL